MERRTMLKTLGGGAAAAMLLPDLAFAAAPADFGRSLADAIAVAERRSGGRLGVSVADLATGRRYAHRGDERFAMCSTFKFPLAAAVLAAVDAGRLRLDRTVPIRPDDLIEHAPEVKKHVGATMTIEALCAAAITLSDGAAANLLIATIGGIDRYNAFLRSVGDRTTRLDRKEPDLASAIPGDSRDTTTPDAMLATMQAILFGPALSPRSRARLTGWLIGNTTGATRLRAGLPRGWRVGDKTGTGENGTYNDIAAIWPTPARRPILVTCYLTGATGTPKAAHAIHAEVARAVATAV